MTPLFAGSASPTPAAPHASTLPRRLGAGAAEALVQLSAPRRSRRQPRDLDAHRHARRPSDAGLTREQALRKAKRPARDAPTHRTR